MTLQKAQKQFLLFTLVGGAQYLLDIALLYVLLIAGVDIVTANIVSRGTVGIAGFIANRYVTFHDTTATLAGSFPKFLLAWVFTSVLSTLGIVGVLHLVYDNSYTPDTAVVVKIIIEILVFLLAFLIQKFWIFSSRS